MINQLRSLPVLVIAGAVVFAVAACGDDSVNPSIPPEASTAKDAAGEGGEGGLEAGGGDDAATEAGGDHASPEAGDGGDGAAEPEAASGEGGAEGGADAGGEGGDAAPD